MTTNVLKTVGLVAAGIALIIGLIYLTGGIKLLTASFRGEVSKTEQVEANGQYRIAAYNDFFNTCAAVQAQEDSIKNQLAERETATPARQAQIDANITASRNSRASLIREYNANASKDYTSGQFKDSDLPYQLSVDAEETTCAA